MSTVSGTRAMKCIRVAQAASFRERPWLKAIRRWAALPPAPRENRKPPGHRTPLKAVAQKELFPGGAGALQVIAAKWASTACRAIWPHRDRTAQGLKGLPWP